MEFLGTGVPPTAAPAACAVILWTLRLLLLRKTACPHIITAAPGQHRHTKGQTGFAQFACRLYNWRKTDISRQHQSDQVGLWRRMQHALTIQQFVDTSAHAPGVRVAPRQGRPLRPRPCMLLTALPCIAVMGGEREGP